MRRILLATMASVSLLTGCFGIGGHWLVPPSSPAGPPFLAHWIKDDMTKESRRNDSWECGAAPTVYAADHVVFSKERFNEFKSSTEDWNQTERRLSKQWRTCMQSKSYVHLENCDARCLYP